MSEADNRSGSQGGDLVLSRERTAIRRQHALVGMDLANLLDRFVADEEELKQKIGVFLPQHYSPSLRIVVTELALAYHEFRTANSPDSVTRFDSALFNYVLSAEKELQSGVQALRKSLSREIEQQKKVRALEAQVKDLSARVESQEASMSELKESNTKWIRRAITDGLTGAYNRPHFDSKLVEEVREAERYSRPLSLLMLDLDHFGLINSNFSHPGGDYVLARFKQLIVDKPSNDDKPLRATDTFCRYGGEEFAIIAPETDENGALLLAQRIVRMIGSTEFKYEEKTIPVTVSIGGAQFSKGDTPEALIRKADDALYHVKNVLGRNNSAAYSQLPPK